MTMNLRPFKYEEEGMSDALASYKSKTKALAELVHNGIDSAYRRNVNPVIEIHFWKKGEHPLAKNFPGISILDNGTGFTEEVWNMYSSVFKSHGKKDAHLQAAHGKGKFGGLALAKNPGEAVYRIISSTGPNEKPQELKLSVKIIHESATNRKPLSFVPVKGFYPGLPKNGPYAMIFVEDINPDIDFEEMFADLAYELPFNPALKLIVNGKELRAPECNFSRSRMFSKELLLGDIKVELGHFKENDQDKIIKRNEIILVDNLNGRAAATLQQIKEFGIKRILLDPRLHGRIWVDGVSKHTTGDRNGLKADYLISKEGKVLIKFLNEKVVEYAHAILDEVETVSSPNNEHFENLLRDSQPLLWNLFGIPKCPYPAEGLRTVKIPRKKPYRNHVENPEPTDDVANPRENGNRKHSGRDRGVLIKFDDDIYEIDIHPLSTGGMPAFVREGAVYKRIMVKPDHPWYSKFCMSKSANNNMLSFIRILLEAHIAFTCDRDGKSVSDAMTNFYTLYEKVLKEVGKK